MFFLRMVRPSCLYFDVQEKWLANLKSLKAAAISPRGALNLHALYFTTIEWKKVGLECLLVQYFNNYFVISCFAVIFINFYFCRTRCHRGRRSTRLPVQPVQGGQQHGHAGGEPQAGSAQQSGSSSFMGGGG